METLQSGNESGCFGPTERSFAADLGLQRVRIDARLPRQGGEIEQGGNFLQPMMLNTASVSK